MDYQKCQNTPRIARYTEFSRRGGEDSAIIYDISLRVTSFMRN